MLVKLWRKQMYFPVHPMPANICHSKTSGFWTPSGWSSQSCGTLTLQEYHPAGSLNLQHDLSLYGVVSSAWHSSSSSPGTHPHNACTSKYTQINATSTISMTPHCLSFSLSLRGVRPANISLKDRAAATAPMLQILFYLSAQMVNKTQGLMMALRER